MGCATKMPAPQNYLLCVCVAACDRHGILKPRRACNVCTSAHGTDTGLFTVQCSWLGQGWHNGLQKWHTAQNRPNALPQELTCRR